MNQAWFEMRRLRRRKLNSATWIPLRASQVIEKTRQYGHLGYREEFYGVHTLAVPIQEREIASRLRWSGLNPHAPYIQDGRYVPADVYELEDSFAINLVLSQEGNSAERRIWHLHYDLILGIGLKREADNWVSINEGYETVARLTRNKDGAPELLEIRAMYLKDFLAAREMALYITSYRRRSFIASDTGIVDWTDSTVQEVEEGVRWEGRISPIHEGGGSVTVSVSGCDCGQVRFL